MHIHRCTHTYKQRCSDSPRKARIREPEEALDAHKGKGKRGKGDKQQQQQQNQPVLLQEGDKNSGMHMYVNARMVS